MNIDRDAQVLRVAEAIAAGEAVDWSSISDCDPETLKRLRQIAELAGQPEAFPRDVTTKPVEQLRWGHLLLEEQIGRGSHGVVYRAYDPLLRRHVALKLCAPDRVVSNKLLREARRMAQIEHPGILKVHGVAEHAGQFGFWSDLIEGEPLLSTQDPKNRFAASQAISLGVEVCAALAAIHAAGVVHGDVKAQNIIRRSDGRYLLVDFGSSVLRSQPTPSGGTPLYQAPELLRGAEAAPNSDMYSLSVLLFRLLTDRFPVEADSLAQLLCAHDTGERQHLLDLRPDLSPELVAAIERALDPQPDRRYASAGAFATALAHTPTRTASIRRRWQPALIAGALFATLAAFLWLSPRAPDVFEDAHLLKTSNGAPVELLDGDRIGSGDSLGLDLKLHEPRYIYLINEDGKGAVFQLFPLINSELKNPLPSGRALRLPGRVDGRDVDWQITSSGAPERFYVIAAHAPIRELENGQAQVTQSQWGRPVDRTSLVAAQNLRGAGGLSARSSESTPSSWPTRQWIEGLKRSYPGLTLRQYELRNP